MSPEEKQQKLAELNARLEAAKKELAKRKKQKETGDQSAPGVPPEVEAKARQYENAADAIMGFDPAMALKYRQQAEAIRGAEVDRQSAEKEFEFEKAQALLKLENPTKAEISDLEQLWKDADRSKRQALALGDNMSADFYQGMQDRIMGKLKVMRPEIWEEGGSTAEGALDTPTQKDKAADVGPLDKQIQSLTVDEDGDGWLDTPASVLSKIISEYASENSIPTNDPRLKALQGFVEARAGEVMDAADKKREIEKEKYDRQLKRQQQAQGTASINAERAKAAVILLTREPESVSNRTEGLNTLLRSESGAAIGKSEVTERISNVLPGNIAQNLLQEQGGIGRFVADKTISDEQFSAIMINRYVNQIDVKKLISQLRIRSGESAASVFGSPETEQNKKKQAEGRFSRFN